MPRYFFDLFHDHVCDADAYGAEMDTEEEAVEQATALLSDIVRDDLVAGRARVFSVCVRDHLGIAVYRASLTFDDSRGGMEAV